MNLFKAKEPKTITQEEQERYRAEFKRKFGIDCDATGAISPEIRCKVAKCAVLRKYGSRLMGELLEDLIGDAYVRSLETETDETRPAWQQLKYLSNAALAEARKTLRKRGYLDGKILQAKQSSDCGEDDYKTRFIESVCDPRWNDAVERFDDDEERRVMTIAVSKYAKCREDREVLQGLLQGLSYAEIGKRIGCVRSRVLQRIKAMRRRAFDDAPEVLSRFLPKPTPKGEKPTDDYDRYFDEGDF